MSERTIRLTVAYDGTGLVGWQRQSSGTSVQGLLEDSLARLEGHHVPVVGAGRTDAGVHALAQVASARIARAITPENLRRALNAFLPAAVRVIEIDEAAADFDARRDATAKTYRYRIVSGHTALPFDLRYAWHLRGHVDVGAMSSAARLLEGEHDFAAFRATGSDIVGTVRTIRRSVVVSERERGWFSEAHPPDRRAVAYEVTGSGFLRHMVRNIVGTLVEIGLGRLPVGAMPEVLASRCRGRAGPTAPAEGLFLVHVEYARTGVTFRHEPGAEDA